jgi:hypothetical protein
VLPPYVDDGQAQFDSSVVVACHVLVLICGGNVGMYEDAVRCKEVAKATVTFQFETLENIFVR